jgi:hypothetical protein
MQRRVAKEQRVGGNHEVYETPAWCYDRLVERLPGVPRGSILEPSAGSGNLVRAIKRHAPDAAVDACEIRVECGLSLEAAGADKVTITNFFDVLPPVGPLYNYAIGNPPYSAAREFVGRCQQWATTTIMLLRLCFLASSERQGWLRENMPDVYVLPNRPSFTGDGRTDGMDYAWMVWRSDNDQSKGIVEVLNSTPAEVRNPKRGRAKEPQEEALPCAG